MGKFRSWKLRVLVVVAALIPTLAVAGPIGWGTMATGASDSMQGMATQATPLLVGAGAMAYAWHLTSLSGGLLTTCAATYVAANGDQVTTLIGGGGVGGSIEDIAKDYAVS